MEHAVENRRATFGRAFLAAVLIAATLRLFRAAESSSEDFHVYWKAVQVWIAGGFPYAISPEDRGFVFKYPPWMLPLFAPFGWIGFEFSKGVWAALELGAIAYCARWLRENGVSRKVTLLTVFLFWYLWLAHYYAGQLTLFLLACALWAVQARGKPSSPKLALLGFLFTAKVFSAYSLLGVFRQILRPRVIAWGIAFLASTHAILFLMASIRGGSGSAGWEALSGLYRGWLEAAASGGAELGAEVVRGTGNHGFTAGILRWIDPEAKKVGWDATLSLALALGLGALWQNFSRTLRFEERWAGWLALGVVAHPLAWHHSFVLAFPLCAFTLQASFENRSKPDGKRSIWIALFGIGLITLLVPQTVGRDWVKPFELISNKSWGVLLCAWVLIRERAQGRKELEPLHD